MNNNRLVTNSNIFKRCCSTIARVTMVVSLLMLSGSFLSAQYTQLNPPNKAGLWFLGPTGAEGMVPSSNPRQIRIDKVSGNSPASGLLLPQDVILGINMPNIEGNENGRFQASAQIVLGKAIMAAERSGTNNVLSLNIWRPETTIDSNGKYKVNKPVVAEEINVDLVLPEMGNYSATSPWNCEKSERLIKHLEVKTSANLARYMDIDSLGNIMDALGLLATGDSKHWPVLRDYSRKWFGMAEELDIWKSGRGCWKFPNGLVFLCEYYLATNDPAVLVPIEQMADFIAKGASGLGTWGHGTADVHENGLYGPPQGYGTMNHTTGICALGLALAQKCGVNNRYIEQSLTLAMNHFEFYIDKGCLPYGDEYPRTDQYDVGGKMSLIALIFNIVGKKEAANYYARMVIASHSRREGCHGSDIWGWLWGGAAAGTAGPEAAAAFSKSTKYYYELARRHNATVSCQRQRGSDANRAAGNSIAGGVLMECSLPRKAMYITGKAGNVVDPIVGEELQEVLGHKAELRDTDNDSTERLLEGLTSPAIPVRKRAAAALRKRSANVRPQLMAMLDDRTNRHARYGACEALKQVGGVGGNRNEVFEKLITIAETDEDWTMRYWALRALVRGGKVQDGYLDSPKTTEFAVRLLKFATVIDPINDPRRRVVALVEPILFRESSFYGEERVNNADRTLLIAALEALLTNPDRGIRSGTSSILKHLDKDLLDQLWGLLHSVIEKQAWASGKQGGGQYQVQAIMAKYLIKEAVPHVISYYLRDGWGKKGRMGTLDDVIAYGSHLLPDIAEEAQTYPQSRDAYEELKNIPGPELVSIQAEIDAYRAKVARERTRVNFLIPEAISEEITVEQNSPERRITLKGYDGDFDPVTFMLTGVGTRNGTLTGTPPNLTYTPNPGFTGTDSFRFKVDDGANVSLEDGTITINVIRASQPYIVNIGFSPEGSDGGVLSGRLTSGDAAAVWLCWGDEDGGVGATGSWDNAVTLGSFEEEVDFHLPINGLVTGKTYWFRCYAKNLNGSAWSTIPDSFKLGENIDRPINDSIALTRSSRDRVTGGDQQSEKNGGVNLGYFLNSGGIVGSVGGNGYRQKHNLVMRYKLPTLSPGEVVSRATLDFLFDPSAHKKKPQLDIYILGLSNPEETGYSLYYEGHPDDTEEYIKHVGYTNQESYKSEFIAASFTLPEEALELLKSLYGSDHIPDQEEVFFRFNTRGGDFNLTRYGINVSEGGSSLELKTKPRYIVNLGVSEVTSDGASINAHAYAVNDNYDINVYWGTADGGTDPNAWENVSAVTAPVKTKAAITHSLTGLSPDTRYYYALRAKSGATEVWTHQTWSFNTSKENAPSAFLAWAGGSDFQADDNGDGVSNAVAWVLGANDSSQATSDMAPTAEIDPEDPDYLLFCYRRTDTAHLDGATTISAEYTTGLHDWKEAIHDGRNVVISEQDDYYAPGVDLVEVRIRKPFVLDATTLFVRLKAKQRETEIR